MSNRKDMIIHLIAGLIKKTLYKHVNIFLNHMSLLEETFVKVDLPNYATKIDLKNVTHVDVSSFALKANLANLKTEVDELDIDKLASVPVDLSKLSEVVKNDVD